MSPAQAHRLVLPRETGRLYLSLEDVTPRRRPSHVAMWSAVATATALLAYVAAFG